MVQTSVKGPLARYLIGSGRKHAVRLLDIRSRSSLRVSMVWFWLPLADNRIWRTAAGLALGDESPVSSIAVPDLGFASRLPVYKKIPIKSIV